MKLKPSYIKKESKKVWEFVRYLSYCQENLDQFKKKKKELNVANVNDGLILVL